MTMFDQVDYESVRRAALLSSDMRHSIELIGMLDRLKDRFGTTFTLERACQEMKDLSEQALKVRRMLLKATKGNRSSRRKKK